MIKKNQFVRIFLGSLFLLLYFHITTVVININKYTITNIMLDATERQLDFIDTFNTLNLYNILFFYILFAFVCGGTVKWFMLPKLNYSMSLRKGQDGDNVYSPDTVITPTNSEELNRDALTSSEQPAFVVNLDEGQKRVQEDRPVVKSKPDHSELARRIDELTR